MQTYICLHFYAESSVKQKNQNKLICPVEMLTIYHVMSSESEETNLQNLQNY